MKHLILLKYGEGFPRGSKVYTTIQILRKGYFPTAHAQISLYQKILIQMFQLHNYFVASICFTPEGRNLIEPTIINSFILYFSLVLKIHPSNLTAYIHSQQVINFLLPTISILSHQYTNVNKSFTHIMFVFHLFINNKIIHMIITHVIHQPEIQREEKGNGILQTCICFTIHRSEGIGLPKLFMRGWSKDGIYSTPLHGYFRVLTPLSPPFTYLLITYGLSLITYLNPLTYYDYPLILRI